MPRKRDGKKAQSPYVKYTKRPHVYSELYRSWKAAVLRGDFGTAARLGRQHTERFRGRRRGEYVDDLPLAA